MSRQNIELKMPNDWTYLPTLLEFVRSISIIHGFDDASARQIELGVEEAVSNVLEHAYDPGEDAYYDVRIELSTSGMMLGIHDMGLPYVPGAVPEPAVCQDSSLEDMEVKSLGTMLMRHAMDKIEYSNLGRKGKEIQLTKFLPSRNITSLCAPDELRPFDESGDAPSPADLDQPAVRPALDLEQVIVRPLEPDDAIYVSRCAYRTYGYSYSSYIYYPEMIVEKNDNGSIYSLVAVDGNGAILGHGAMEFDYPGARIAEIGVLFVMPQYRRSGLTVKMAVNVFAKALEMGLEGMYGRTVTSHQGSQKIGSNHGGISCGFQLGAYIQLNFKAINGQKQTRESLAITYLPLKPREAVKLYIPARYVALAEKIYGNMKFVVEISTEQEPVPGIAEFSEIHTVKIPEIGCAYIYVNEVGREADNELRSRLRALCLEKTDSIFVYLDVQNPATAWLAEQCRQMGFIFGAILPFGAQTGHDALIMQYVNNPDIDFDSISVFSELAQEMLEFIKSEYQTVYS